MLNVNLFNAKSFANKIIMQSSKQAKKLLTFESSSDGTAVACQTKMVMHETINHLMLDTF